MNKCKKIRFFGAAVLSALAMSFACAYADSQADGERTPISLQTSPKMRNETRYMVFCLERAHYLKTAVTDLDVREFIREYMQNIDFFKLFFTANDVQYFQDWFAPSIDITLRQGSLLPAFTIYEKFLERADERMKWMERRMKEPFDFSKPDTFRPDRSKENWPKNWEEANELWDKRLKYDIINQILGYGDDVDPMPEIDGEPPMNPPVPAAKKNSENSPVKPSEKASEKPSENSSAQVSVEDEARVAQMQKDSPKTFAEKLAKAEEEVLSRYERIINNYRKADAIEIQEIYLNTLSHLYDPHSGFLSEYFLEEFDISVRNALIGIGAVLQDKDGYCVINELMVGGPAEESGQLKPGDKIVGVGQQTGEIVDTVGMKLRKVVHMIRGPEGSKVRLLIQPAANPSARKLVVLVRKEIKLTTKLAKADIYTVPVGDRTVPIGVIDLPAFYGDGVGANSNAKIGFSTSRDVEELVGKLKARGVKGIILDLRRNGGGFLNEAVDLAGLFIKSGPVVQVRDASGRVSRLRDENEKIVWDGPLMILVSRLSASATEIVAGALQNHQRAIIVGDKSTHGKGSVQAVYNLNNFDPEQKSAAKVTVQKWYAPNGESIQVKGVHSDIVLPSVYDYMEIGEQYKDYALKWDSITPDSIEELYGYGFPKGEAEKLMAELTKQSEARRANLEEFKVWNERIARFKKLQDKKDWSVNLKEREDELKENEAFSEKMKAKQKELAALNFKKEEILLDSAQAELDKEAAKAAKEKSDNSGQKPAASAEASAGGAAAASAPESADKPAEKVADSKKSGKKPSKKSGASLVDDSDEDVPEFDVQLREALRIMGDVISLQAKRNSVPAPSAGEAPKPLAQRR